MFGIDAGATQKPSIALALENLLLKVQPPATLWLNGPLDASGLATGTLNLRFQAQSVLPTLPDPYAANFEAWSFGDAGDTSVGVVTASVRWPDPAHPTLEFALQTAGAQTAPARGLATLGREGPNLFMLDLSSNADQFGVVVPLLSAASQLALDGLSLVAPAGRIGIFTLPPISWEPMLSKQPNPVDDAVLPPPPNDGGAALLSAESVTLVPVAPVPLLTEYIEAVNHDRPFYARLPLPFGVVANIDTRPLEPDDGPSTFIADGGLFGLNQPTFPSDLTGGRQLLLQAPDSQIAGMDRHFPAPSHTDADTSGYAAGVLSQNIYTRWVGDFGPKGARVERYELIGYGASLFSDWRDQSSIGP